jgi:signal transduction histidine kinase
MPGISQKTFYSTIQRPAADALDLLSAYSRNIVLRWSTALLEMGVRVDDILPVRALPFDSLARALRHSTLAAFRRQIHALARRIGRRGIRFETAAAALNRLFEICLPYIPRGSAVGFARLHALIGMLIAAEYAGVPDSAAPGLAEIDLTGAQRKLRDGSSYVTRVYERERRRLSHDLHDEVGHDLVIIKLYLEMIRLSLQGRAVADVKPRLDEAIGLVSHAIDAVRRLVLDLNPAVFDELGFLPAVKSYTEQFSASTRIPVIVEESTLPHNVPLTHQIAMYRLLQGALSNVVKHAHASQVRVSFCNVKDATLIMVIEDDGVGFDTAQKPGRRSFGLTAMRERVAALGGRILVESARAGPFESKHGTRIEVDLPLTATAEK